MKRILTLLFLSAILSCALSAAFVDGLWRVEGSDRTAPQRLSIRVSGNQLVGIMDGVPIADGRVEGDFFWFHVLRNGVNTLFKGQMKQGKIDLRESSTQVNRRLSFARVSGGSR